VLLHREGIDMIRNRYLPQLLSIFALSLAACATADEDARSTADRDQAVRELQHQAGAPVALEVGATGEARVLAMTPRFPVPGHASDPAVVAQDFVATHHAVFQLDAAEATSATSS
jgi:hypothetical protein